VLRTYLEKFQIKKEQECFFRGVVRHKYFHATAYPINSATDTIQNVRAQRASRDYLSAQIINGQVTLASGSLILFLISEYMVQKANKYIYIYIYAN
jgi:hypothetical protein